MQAYRLAAEKEWTSANGSELFLAGASFSGLTTARREVRREDTCFPPALEGKKDRGKEKNKHFSHPETPVPSFLHKGSGFSSMFPSLTTDRRSYLQPGWGASSAKLRSTDIQNLPDVCRDREGAGS